MDIIWLGHACFRLHSPDRAVITDPFPPELGLRADPRPATVVTLSSAAPNHAHWEGVAGEPKVFRAPGEYEYNGITVRGVMTPLPPGAAQEARNVAYTIEFDGVNICHLGNLSAQLTTRQADELKPVDVLLAPLGGQCSLDETHQTLQDLDPRIVVPMRFETGRLEEPAEPVEPFLRRMGLDELATNPRLQVTRNNLPADLRVSLLTPPRG